MLATHVMRNKARPIGMLAMFVVSVLMSTMPASAQGAGDRHQAGTPTSIRESLRVAAVAIPLDSRGPAPASQQPAQPGRQRSIQRKVLGGIVGGVGGFFGGLFLGAAIEGDRCNCDDPGLKGALIGGPVGAAAGGILGYKLLF